jgi:hypothetical protein
MQKNLKRVAKLQDSVAPEGVIEIRSNAPLDDISDIKALERTVGIQVFECLRL